MTRFKCLLAVLSVAAIVALVAGAPVAQAQTAHFVGAGSSAQFTMAGIAADQAAENANTALYGGANVIKHWSKKFSASTGDGAKLNDTRHTGIADQTGNIWIVWIENTAGTAVTDYWLDVSVDSTVGVRCALAKAATTTQGCQAEVTSANGTGTDNAIPSSPTSLWPDGKADATLDLPIINAINAGGGAYVTVGLTDITAEDAAEATQRLLGTLDTTDLSGLGDGSGTDGIGDNIWTGQGTGSFAQPVGFALPGEKDPFTSLVVPTTTVTYSIGAAPIVFIANNGGTPWTGAALNLVSGVTPTTTDTANGQVHPLASLFDGTDPAGCATGAVALGKQSPSVPLTVFEREALSGTMNTTEYSLFRTTGNSTDSQELGWTYPSVEAGAGTTAPCTGSHGVRSRAIGTSEVVGKSGAYGLLGTSNSLGYIFTSFSNLGKFSGKSNFQYLTLDDVDPLFGGPTAYSECVLAGEPTGQICGADEACSSGTCTAGGNSAQTVPNCTTHLCTTDLWDSYTTLGTSFTIPAGISYPNLRNGQYLAWSIYRWVVPNPTTDPYGPALVAQEAQNYVDGDVADFVPFAACSPGSGATCLATEPVDGLDVYRSHYKDTAQKYKCPAGSGNPDNGAVTNTNAIDGGNTLGGTAECGGDAGGAIQGPFGDKYPSITWVVWASTTTKAAKGEYGYLATELKKVNQAFTDTNPATGDTVYLFCTDSSGVQHEYSTTVLDNKNKKIFLTTGNPLAAPSNSLACKLLDPTYAPGAIENPPTAAENVKKERQ